MSERHGSIWTPGAYQGPATDSAQLVRGQPLRELRWTIGTERIELRLVPLRGGRPELFEIEYQRNDPVARSSVYVPCVIRGTDYARRAFARTAAELDAGGIPEAVLTPPGTPLGP